MECPRRATLLVVLSTIYVSAVCQNVLDGDSRLPSQSLVLDSNTSPKTQLMNTLFSLASGKPGFPEPAPAMIQEKQYVMNQNQRPLCNVVSMSPIPPKEAIPVSQPIITTNSLPQPAIPFNSMNNMVMGNSFPTPYILPYQPGIPSYIPRPPQVIPLENYANMVQTYPKVWQMQPTKDVYYNSIPPPIVPVIDTGIYDITTNCNSDIPDAVINDSDQALPFNVHINVPPTNIPAPRITLISPPPTPALKPEPNPYPQFGYPPIIMRKSRSSWKKILPIILIALFTDQDHGGCCPCNCACNSDSPTPIPYPIAIPVSNPIINNAASSKYSSRRRENVPNEDDNEN